MTTSGCAGATARWEESGQPAAAAASGPAGTGADIAQTPTAPASTATPTPATLDDYLARMPTFAAAPNPVPVRLYHPDGQAAWMNAIPTGHPVAFITIDDGLNRHPWANDLIRASKVPVTLFLTTKYISGHRDYFQVLRDAGDVVVEGHTVSHAKLVELTYDEQRHELCHATDLLEQWFGTRPVFFRPPYGEKNDDTMRAALSCGLQAGFHWREAVDKGVVYYQRKDNRVHAGDIILMHFRPAFPDDFLAALIAIKESGLTPALLEDYVAADL
jgi:peptidoglycan/xylan/chitin deacetylase (PgdA/CDA1 family)